MLVLDNTPGSSGAGPYSFTAARREAAPHQPHGPTNRCCDYYYYYYYYYYYDYYYYYYY